MNEGDETPAARTMYSEVLPLYERLVAEVKHVLETKLKDAGIAAASIIGRTKDVDSFLSKITRKRYTNPLLQTTDLAGVRVVCAYESELAKVAEIIKSNFAVRECIDKSRDLGVDRMGYKGKAYVVTLGKGYAGVRYEDITDLVCEI